MPIRSASSCNRPGCGGRVSDGVCSACGSQRSDRYGSNVRRPIPTTLVCGPPGSGKTTYVREKARSGDLIVDVDAIYAALSGEPWYAKPAGLLPVVLAVRDAILEQIRMGNDDIARAWVISSEEDPNKRAELLQQCGGGKLVVLEVSGGECLRRIAADPRRGVHADLWKPLIDKWWAGHWHGVDETIVRS